MDNFTYHNYTEVIFGKGVEAQVGQKAGELVGGGDRGAGTGTKILLHYGGGSIKATGLYDRVVDALRASGVDFIELAGAVPNPRLSLVREGIELCRREGVHAILAVGGGSAIDSAKAIAAGVHYEGDVWELFQGAAFDHEALSLGVLLTIPAAGSETSPNSVITNEHGLIKKGLRNQKLRPKFALLNPELSYTLPFYQTACGVSDMLAHIMERYFSNSSEVDLSDRLCEAAMRSILYTAPALKSEPGNYGARANIMWAGTLAHGGLLGMGREEDWGSHHIEHEISAIYDLAHGAGLSIVFPAWIKYVYKYNIPRFHQWAVRVFDVDTAYYDPESAILEGVRRLECFFRAIELPIRLSEAGIGSEDIELMAEKGSPTGKFLELKKEDIREILMLAL